MFLPQTWCSKASVRASGVSSSSASHSQRVKRIRSIRISIQQTPAKEGRRNCIALKKSTSFNATNTFDHHANSNILLTYQITNSSYNHKTQIIFWSSRTSDRIYITILLLTTVSTSNNCSLLRPWWLNLFYNHSDNFANPTALPFILGTISP